MLIHPVPTVSFQWHVQKVHMKKSRNCADSQRNVLSQDKVENRDLPTTVPNDSARWPPRHRGPRWVTRLTRAPLLLAVPSLDRGAQLCHPHSAEMKFQDLYFMARKREEVPFSMITGRVKGSSGLFNGCRFDSLSSGCTVQTF